MIYILELLGNYSFNLKNEDHWSPILVLLAFINVHTKLMPKEKSNHGCL